MKPRDCLALVLMMVLPILAFAGELQELVEPQSTDWTRDGLKALLDTPLVLFGIMLLASMANSLKQLRTVRAAGGASMSFADYWSHLPDAMATVLGNGLAFAVLIMTDQLNLAAALGIGYGVNSLTDLLPGSRSDQLLKRKD